MIDKNKYRAIIPECKIVNQNHNTEIKLMDLFCFDYIYDVVNLSKEEYAYGVFITTEQSHYIFDCLYDTYVYSSHHYHVPNLRNYNPGSDGDIVLPMFIVYDHAGKPIPVEKFNSERFFSEYIEPYKNMSEAFKIKKDGFFQVENNRTHQMFITQKITKNIYPCNESNVFNNYRIGGTLRRFFIHFLNEREIDEMYDINELYAFVEKYAYCYVQKHHDYMFEDDFLEIITKAEGIIEPILLDETQDSIPLMKYHSIFFPSRYRYKHFMADIVNDNTQEPNVISFFSSESDDPVNQIFKSILSLLVRGDIKFTTVLQNDFSKTSIESEYIITLNPLKNNKHFIDHNIKNNLIMPVNVLVFVKGYGMVNMKSTEYFKVEPSFFNVLKLKSDDDIKHIKEITVNKYLLDVTMDDDSTEFLINQTYAAYLKK